MKSASVLFVILLHLIIGPLAQIFILVFVLYLFFEVLFSKRKRKNSALSIPLVVLLGVSFRFYFIWYGDYRLKEEGDKVREYFIKNLQYPSKVDSTLFSCLFCEGIKYETKFDNQKFPLLYYNLSYPFERRRFVFDPNLSDKIKDF